MESLKFERVVSSKEILERALPQALEDALEYYYNDHFREVAYLLQQTKNEDLFSAVAYLLEKTKNEDLRQELEKTARVITAKEKNKNSLAKEMIRSPRHLEAIALLDLGAETLEERKQKTQAKRKQEIESLNKRAAELDTLKEWLISENPELNKEYKKEDFKKWLKELLARKAEEIRGIKAAGKIEAGPKKAGREALEKICMAQYKIADRVFTSAPLRRQDLPLFFSLIEEDMTENRRKTSEELSNFLLHQNFSRDKLAAHLREIDMLETFKARAEGDWINF